MIGNNLYKNSKKKNLLPKILAASLVLVSQLPVDSYALPKNDTTKTKKKSLIINKGDAKVAVPTLGFVLLFCVGGPIFCKYKKTLHMKKGYTNFEDLSTNLENVLTFREFKDTYLKILRLIINEGYQRDF